MLHSRIFAGVLLCTVASEGAVAEVKVCNDYQHNVWVAVGWVENHDTRTKGWYQVNSGTCVVVDSRAMQRPYYIYAETNWRDSPSGTRIQNSWGGKVKLAVGRDDRFDYVRAQTISDNDRAVSFKDLAEGSSGTPDNVTYRLESDGVHTTTTYSN